MLGSPALPLPAPHNKYSPPRHQSAHVAESWLSRGVPPPCSPPSPPPTYPPSLSSGDDPPTLPQPTPWPPQVGPALLWDMASLADPTLEYAFLGVVPFARLSAAALAAHSTGRAAVIWLAIIHPIALCLVQACNRMHFTL